MFRSDWGPVIGVLQPNLFLLTLKAYQNVGNRKTKKTLYKPYILDNNYLFICGFRRDIGNESKVLCVDLMRKAPWILLVKTIVCKMCGT